MGVTSLAGGEEADCFGVGDPLGRQRKDIALAFNNGGTEHDPTTREKARIHGERELAVFAHAVVGQQAEKAGNRILHVNADLLVGYQRRTFKNSADFEGSVKKHGAWRLKPQHAICWGGESRVDGHQQEQENSNRIRDHGREHLLLCGTLVILHRASTHATVGEKIAEIWEWPILANVQRMQF